MWAVPAAIMGGEEYRNAIFWGQSAGRMVDSFAHGRPWWWFLAVLPGLILPWTLWPACWRALAGLLDIGKDNGLRFCLIWFLPALVAFSAISGKQLHYLLPVFPALALIGGRLLVDYFSAAVMDGFDASWNRSGLHLPGALFVVLGLALSTLPIIADVFDLPAIFTDMNFLWGLGLALLALAVIYMTSGGGLMARLAAISVLSMAFVVSLHLSLRPVLAQVFDLKPMSVMLGQWQRDGIKLGYSGKYHGQFNFLGRLEETIPSLGLRAPDLENWLADNPEGRMVLIAGKPPAQTTPLYMQPFRGRYLIVIDTAQALAYPEIIQKP